MATRVAQRCLAAVGRRTLLQASMATSRGFPNAVSPVLWRQGAVSFKANNTPSRAFTAAVNEVQIISDLEGFNTACDKNKGKLIVAYHTAAWCGPCKMIWPHVQKIAANNPNVTFLKIDVDEVQDVAAANGITAMPTFLFLKDGKVMDKLVGASPPQLEKLVAKHA